MFFVRISFLSGLNFPVLLFVDVPTRCCGREGLTQKRAYSADVSGVSFACSNPLPLAGAVLPSRT